MNEHEPVDCSFIINYLTGECTELERASYERHLRTCVSCQEELRELQAVWQTLPFHMEEVEVPADLKQQVMRSIGVTEPPKRKRSFTWLYGTAAVIVLGIMAGTWWNYSESARSKEAASALLRNPAEVVNTFTLKSADSSMPSALGTAWIVQHGEAYNVVVNLSGLKETQGDWAYQVWLNHNGKKYNCGTLRVDDKGIGVLSYDVRVKELHIDSIGVTLEPDPNGTQPRGKKVLGS
ncbi:anti-sigma factor domain-containing protein [Paenibacillus sedimenti]|uniref:Anti-sigma-W factor RsiW n=1 Tax=Paenibacillus sedimenti TaxID=2770274 RepID=A0A926QGX8_9BACL|nr:anti-sigma factor [Paenibacillus sedimenti]MBD0378910.1 anti-sigma factor [Paenibacillus sedimenti]